MNSIEDIRNYLRLCPEYGTAGQPRREEVLPPPIDYSGRPPDQLMAGPTDGALISQRYRIEHKIGEGGMGKVYQVAHLRLKKSFALKLMHEEVMERPDQVERFVREARTLIAIDHPVIVSVLDAGMADGRYAPIRPDDVKRLLDCRFNPAGLDNQIGAAAVGQRQNGFFDIILLDIEHVVNIHPTGGRETGVFILIGAGYHHATRAGRLDRIRRQQTDRSAAQHNDKILRVDFGSFQCTFYHHR